MQITLQLWEGVEGYDGERSLGDSTADCARRPVTPAPVTLHTIRTHYGPVSSCTQSLILHTDISSSTCLDHVHVYLYTCMYSTPDTPPLPTSKILNTCTRTCRNTMYVHNIHVCCKTLTGMDELHCIRPCSSCIPIRVLQQICCCGAYSP